MSIKYDAEMDIIIVGAGIIGLSIAYELSNRFKNLSFALMEQAPYLGDHISGRNSGVLHAGIYYENNSLKHKLCIEGNQAWYKLCNDMSISVDNCGKYIVASSKDPSQNIMLRNIFKNANDNHVQKMRWATEKEIQELNKNLYCDQAIYSGTTGVIDVSMALKVLNDEIFKKNVPVLLKNKVSQIEKNNQNDGMIVFCDNEKYLCKVLINCAGLGAIELRKKLGLNDLENYYVMGRYLGTRQKFPFNSLIYPVQDKNSKGLGVHYTFDLQGDRRFGPDTVDVCEIDYKVDDSIKSQMLPAMSNLFRNIKEDQLFPDFSGIRPKIIKSGNLYKDFWIKSWKNKGLNHYIELCGIESPGLTSAPAIAKMVANYL